MLVQISLPEALSLALRGYRYKIYLQSWLKLRREKFSIDFYLAHNLWKR
jgi:hypothetical protein